MSQETLATKVKVHKRTVENAEKGRRVQRFILNDIAKALGIPVDSLIAPSPIAVSQELLDAIPIPIFFKDRTGFYRGCNAEFCRFLGRTRSQVVGKLVSDVTHMRDASVYKEKDEQLFSLGDGGRQIYPFFVEAGEKRTTVVFYKGIFTFNGVQGIVGAIVESTDFISIHLGAERSSRTVAKPTRSTKVRKKRK